MILFKQVLPFIEEKKVLDGFVNENFVANEIMCVNKKEEVK